MRKSLMLPIFGVVFSASLALQGCAPLSQTQSGSDVSVESQYASAPSSSLEAMRAGQGASEGPLKRIYFDFDRHELRADAREALKANAEWLKANPSVRIEVEGHCDERGTNEYNLALGARRAHAARDYLTTLGIAPDRLATISYGEEAPVCRDQSEGCWQRNRNARFATISSQPLSVSQAISK